MKRLIWLAVALFAFVCTSMAIDDPAATSGNTIYSELDAFGDVLGTIPSSAPGTNNAWVGMTYANGELIECKNVYPSSVPSQFLRINPTTGAVIATVNLPFNGYVIGCAAAGNDLWIVQWSPLNMVYKVSIAGTQLASFAPNVSPYSARSAAWDGTNLWVGCNQSSGVTKLVKFSPTGTNLQEFATGSVVGWYMDAEWDPSATNGPLIVVDNVGNELLRLNIAASVTMVEQHVSQAVAPDVAEGIAYDGENLWHDGAYASLGLIWKLDDGFTSQALNLDVTLTPTGSTVIPAQGGNLLFDVAVVNNGPVQGTFTGWARIKNPNGTYTDPTLGPIAISPAVGQTVSRSRVQTIPGTWPSGAYQYIAYVNMNFAYPAIDSASFNWTKSADMGNGPWVTELSNYGEPFPGEVMNVPTTHAVLSAYPNPFNPATTISFSLPEAQRVTLNVYDMNGRLVSTLVNGYRAAGNHSITFDGSDLASGVYLYSLTANGHTATAKMVLMK